MANQVTACLSGISSILVDATDPLCRVSGHLRCGFGICSRDPSTVQGFLMTHNDTPQVSVVLCSRDRSEQVSRCLERFDLSELVKLNGELVLVDNA